MAVLSSIRRLLRHYRSACRFVELHVGGVVERLTARIEPWAGVDVASRCTRLRSSTELMVQARAVLRRRGHAA